MNNIIEFKEIKQMGMSAITHHSDPAYASNKSILESRGGFITVISETLFLVELLEITRLRSESFAQFTRVGAPDPDADNQSNVVYLSKVRVGNGLPAAEINN